MRSRKINFKKCRFSGERKKFVNLKICLTHFFPILTNISNISKPPKNNRKPYPFLMFSGGIEITLRSYGLINLTHGRITRN